MEYLGVTRKKPKVAIFDFTGCEGCELQLVNKEETLVDFLEALDVKAFREASSARDDDYDIALIEGAVSREDEIARLQEIRGKAKIVAALGSCACFGGINRLKNRWNPAAVNREVYGDDPKDTLPVNPLSRVVRVDLEIPGCPVSKREVESVITHLIWELPFRLPAYPVCLECRQRFTTCVFERGLLCLGPIARAGCGAPCPAGGLGCWGCRGPAEAPNIESFLRIAAQSGFSAREIRERLSLSGAFDEVQ